MNYGLSSLLISSVYLAIFWLAAKFIKSVFPVLKRLFLPCALIAGTIALIFIAHPFEALHFIPQDTIRLWTALPSPLINVVFACLFLGKSIISASETWELAGPQVIFGQTLAWGQYAVGIALTLLVLTPFFEINPLAGTLIEISFEGGHGTAAGLGPVFRDLGFADGADLAIGLATIGIIAGIFSGIILVNWAHRTNKTTIKKSSGVDRKTEDIDPIALDDEAHPDSPLWLQKSKILSLLLHLTYVVIAIAAGRLILNSLISLEQLTWAKNNDLELMGSLPLFPLAMIGGVIVQYALSRFGKSDLVDRDMINRIGTAALDVLILCAVATMSLSVLGKYLIPVILLAAAGILWNILAFVLLAPKIIPHFWFERGIGDLGQSMGMTATGLLLMRVTDPKNSSRALESFGYKQLFFEPIVGGGLFTATSPILLDQFGSVPLLILTFVLCISWLIFGLVRSREKRHVG